jgi:hypothetical protein
VAQHHDFLPGLILFVFFRVSLMLKDCQSTRRSKDVSAAQAKLRGATDHLA